MTRLVLAGVVVAAVAAAPRPAHACGVVPLGSVLADIAVSLEGEHAPISTPIVVAGTGFTTEGFGGSIALGWAWGDRQRGGLFPGSSIRRVMLGIRTPFAAPDADAMAVARSDGAVDDGGDGGRATRLSLTYGWFDNALFDAGFDFGVAGTRDQLGPTAILTLGLGGIDLRLTGGVEFGDDKRFAGAAELVLDVMSLAGRI